MVLTLMKCDAHITCTVLDNIRHSSDNIRHSSDNIRHSLPILGGLLFAVDTSDMDFWQDGKIVCNCCMTFNLVHVSWDLESLVVDQVFCPLLVMEVFDTILGICLYLEHQVGKLSLGISPR